MIGKKEKSSKHFWPFNLSCSLGRNKMTSKICSMPHLSNSKLSRLNWWPKSQPTQKAKSRLKFLLFRSWLKLNHLSRRQNNQICRLESLKRQWMVTYKKTRSSPSWSTKPWAAVPTTTTVPKIIGNSIRARRYFQKPKLIKRFKTWWRCKWKFKTKSTFPPALMTNWQRTMTCKKLRKSLIN